MKRFVFYVALWAASLSFAQSKATQETFAPFIGKWQGVFKVFSYEGRLLDHITVEQHYWWESGEQHAAFIERGRDGRVVHAHARNYKKDGELYCEVKKGDISSVSERMKKCHCVLCYSAMASASISTSISGMIRRLTCTMLVAGRIAPKNSPCALPIFSHSSMLVT